MPPRPQDTLAGLPGTRERLGHGGCHPLALLLCAGGPRPSRPSRACPSPPSPPRSGRGHGGPLDDLGDGQAGRPRPVPPGQLVVTAVVPASGVERGPELPLFLERVPAGFPSPADDYVEDRLDLHEPTRAGSPSCFFLHVSGESMAGDGILDGDVLVVDRAAEPVSGSVVVASVDGELTVKRFVRRAGRTMLLAANPAYPPIELQDGQDLVVWGVVTHSLHDHRVRRRDR